MDQFAHLYAGHYNNEKDSYLVFGSFVLIPKNTVGSIAPTFDILMVNYNGTNELTGKLEYPFQKSVYILIDGSVSSIGEILNQKPQPFNHPFFDNLKEIVMEEYNKVRASEKE